MAVGRTSFRSTSTSSPAEDGLSDSTRETAARLRPRPTVVEKLWPEHPATMPSAKPSSSITAPSASSASSNTTSAKRISAGANSASRPQTQPHVRNRAVRAHVGSLLPQELRRAHPHHRAVLGLQKRPHGRQGSRDRSTGLKPQFQVADTDRFEETVDQVRTILPAPIAKSRTSPSTRGRSSSTRWSRTCATPA